MKKELYIKKKIENTEISESSNSSLQESFNIDIFNSEVEKEEKRNISNLELKNTQNSGDNF